jgi:hypothetical protein
MSLAGRQPLTQPSTDYMNGFTPNSVMQGNNQNYATQASVYGTQVQNSLGQQGIAQKWFQIL